MNMKLPAPEEFSYTLSLDASGVATLKMGDEQMWTSANDAQFIEDFGDEVVDDSDLPDVHDWLEKNNYVPPGVDVLCEGQETEWVSPGETDEDDNEGDDDENSALD